MSKFYKAEDVNKLLADSELGTEGMYTTYMIDIFRLATLRKYEFDPDKHGTWVRVSPFTDTLMCSECGYNIVDEEMATPHCPWCGLPMRWPDGRAVDEEDDECFEG